jgi:hypothetical protein
MNDRKGLPVMSFNIGEKVMLANPYLTVNSENEIDDVFTVVKTELSFGEWRDAVNDRTGRGYVMSDGDYCRASKTIHEMVNELGLGGEAFGKTLMDIHKES